MLSQNRRLRAKEVEEVLSLGRPVRGGHLSMKFLQKKSPFRLAVVVPKSLARKATLRNKLRRAAYDSFPTLSQRTGHAVFFVRIIPKEPLRTVFKEEMATLLAKI
jgi:ribonuclease P protein component